MRTKEGIFDPLGGVSCDVGRRKADMATAALACCTTAGYISMLDVQTWLL